MASRTLNWLNQRWPLSAVIRWSLDEEIPGGPRFAYTLGSSALFVFLVLVVTGIWQLLYYVPTTDHAYESVTYLRTQVPMGWLIHGLHYWASNAFVVLVCLHVGRVFIWAAYKKPRELTWLTGAVLLLLVLGMTFTGAVLAWDELGYWAGQVGTTIAGTVPGVGDVLKRFLRGGASMDQLALSRFFVFHIALFAGLLGTFIVVHLVALRQAGSVGPWNPEKARTAGPFWPDQVFKDLIVISVIFLALVALSAYAPPPVTGPADPVDTTYTPKPEMSFMFLYQALKALKGAWEPVGTVGIPLVLILALVLLPFYDRREERRPTKRRVAMAAGFLLAAGIVALTVAGYCSGPAYTETVPQEPAAAPQAAAAQSPAAKRGEELYRSQGCLACHSVSGPGSSTGLGMASEGCRGRSREWLIAQIRNPQSHNPESFMPPFTTLGDSEVNDLADYLTSLTAECGPSPETGLPQAGKAASMAALARFGGAFAAPPVPASGKQGPPGRAADMVGDADHGKVLYGETCLVCHGPEGKFSVPNPGSTRGRVAPLSGIDPALFDEDPAVFAANIDRFLQHGSMPDGPHPALYMPAFGATNTLTQQKIAQIEAYILSMNGVDRARIMHPGLSPGLFFGFVAAAMAVAWLVLGAWWMNLRKRGLNT